MPIIAPSPIVAERTTAPGETTTPEPSTAGAVRVPCTSALSRMAEPWPMVTLPASPAYGGLTQASMTSRERTTRRRCAPRTDEPYQSELRPPSVTSPTVVADDATNASAPCVSVFALKATTRVEGTTVLCADRRATQGAVGGGLQSLLVCPQGEDMDCRDTHGLRRIRPCPASRAPRCRRPSPNGAALRPGHASRGH